MEHSKEFYIQQYLQENDLEHIKLKMIKLITRLYKILKLKRENAQSKQLLLNFNNFIDRNELGEDLINNTTYSNKLKNIGTNNILDKYEHNKNTTNGYTESLPPSGLSLKTVKTDFKNNGNNIQRDSKHHK